MKTKAIIASTLLTAALAGTSAIAGDNDYLRTYAENSTAETFVIKHAYFITPAVVAVNTEEAVNR